MQPMIPVNQQSEGHVLLTTYGCKKQAHDLLRHVDVYTCFVAVAIHRVPCVIFAMTVVTGTIISCVFA